MRLSFVCLLVLLSLVSLRTYSQTRADSLIKFLDNQQGQAKVDLLNEIAKEYRNSERLTSMNYAMLAYSLSNNINYNAGKALSMKNIGIIYFFIGKNDSALYYYQKSSEIYAVLKDKSGQAACLNNIGLINQEIGEYDNALNTYTQAKDLYKELKDESSVGTLLMNMSEVEIFKGNSRQALSYMDEALRLFKKTKDEYGIMTVYNNRSAAYDNLGRFDDALHDIESYIKLAVKMEDRYSEARGYSNKALYQFHNGEDKEAVQSIHQSLSISDESDDGYNIFNTYIIYADILTYQNDYKRSNEFLQKALKKCEEMQNKRQVARILTSIGRNLMEINEIDKAKGYFLQSLEIAQSIGAGQELLPNYYNLSLIEAIVRNYAVSDSFNTLYVKTLLQLDKPENTVIDEDSSNKSDIVKWILLITSVIVIGVATFLIIRKVRK